MERFHCFPIHPPHLKILAEMKKFLPALVAAIVSSALFSACFGAEVKLETTSYKEYKDGRKAMQEDISSKHEQNLLNFATVKITSAPWSTDNSRISDGMINTVVAVTGKPSKFRVYLGHPRPLKEIAIYTNNKDSRSNQDYEIRLENNSANPGVAPRFNSEPTYTTGDTVIGANGGPFRSRFAAESGSLLGDGLFDWIEIRFWNTYPTVAGEPGKRKTKGTSQMLMCEVQIIGDSAHPAYYAPGEQELNITMKKQRLLEAQVNEIHPDLSAASKQRPSLRKAIEDLYAKYPERYKDKNYLAQLDKYDSIFNALDFDKPETVEALRAVAEEFLAFRREALLSNPLLDFDRVLVRTGSNPGLLSNWNANTLRKKIDWDNKLQVISLHDAAGELKPVVEPRKGSFIGDVCLKWDAKSILVTGLSDKNTWEVYEVDLEKALKGLPVEYKQISPFMGDDIDNVEGCFVPDGSYLFISSASMMGVPCVGGRGHVGNIFRVESDLKTVRQLTFEQDQDWHPTLMNNGRIMYLRWEYVDINHYFTRIMMHMNPDGTNQVELYGSGSYWPNSMFFSKPIPGNNSAFVTIVSGHHGTARAGELHVIDPKRGRKEAEGSVCQIPFSGQKVEPRIMDRLVDGSWPKFLAPCPLSDNYFLVSAKISQDAPWALYLVDTFDNMLLIKSSDSFGIFEPQAIQEKPMPPVIPDRTLEKDKQASAYITDVYFGPGLENVPRGTVKSLRVFTYQYGYRGIGGHNSMGEETSWDSKVLLGEVKVEPDGSANFVIPSNVPVGLQPLDENGNALQLMRSWLTGMPGERVTCSGCHENQNSVTPAKFNMAARRAPDEIVQFNGPKRPIGFTREVQPVLDKYCVGCHNGEEKNRPNFADTTIGPRGLGNSYWALMPYLRRPGPESDTAMFYPMEYYANTSPLIQMLRDGNHYNVKLDPVASRELSLWIDMNMPYHATWSEVAAANRKGDTSEIETMAKRTQQLRALYANVDDNPEDGAFFQPTRPEFVKPAQWITPDTKNPTGLKSIINNCKSKVQSVDLGSGVTMELAYIPSGKFVIGDDSQVRPEENRNEVAIEKPFYMGTTEVTNAMFKQFNPNHQSNFIDQQWKDHVHRGYPANMDSQPVVRVSWQEANEFCKWLSEKTGKKFSLPTEAQWEWAAKAGTDQPFWWSPNLGKAAAADNGRLTGCDVQFADKANFADASMRLFVVRGVNPQPISRPAHWDTFLPRVDDQDDNQMIPGWDGDLYKELLADYHGSKGTARYMPNPWGLYDMNGNVAEWTLSDYKPYPYNAADGRNDGNVENEKSVRGGSWFDRPAQCRNGSRLPYPTYQKVYNVGFRVVCEE